MKLNYRGLPAILFLIAIFFSGCQKENMCDCLKSTGKTITERRPLVEFSEIEVRKNVFVTLCQDTVNYAEVEGGENLVSLVRTDVENGILKITNDNTCNWVRSYKKEIHVTLHFRNLTHLRHYGSKDVDCYGTWKNSLIRAEVHSGGDIHLKVECDTSYIGLFANAGDAYLEGITKQSYLFSQSFGFIYQQNLLNDSCQVDHRGTGDLYVTGKTWLRVSITRVGNVYYSGDPLISSSFYSSGKLIHL